MDIEEQKRKFLDILRTTYKAKRANWKESGLNSIGKDVGYSFGESLEDYEKEERVRISEDILIKYGLEGRDFWDIICPSLKEDGVLKSFGNPNDIPAEYYKRSGCEELQNKLRELYKELSVSRMGDGQKSKGIEDEMKKIEKELAPTMRLVRNFYPFFVVDKNKLFGIEIIADAKKRPTALIETNNETQWSNLGMRLQTEYDLLIKIPKRGWLPFTFQDLGLTTANGKIDKQGKMLKKMLENKGEYILAAGLRDRNKESQQKIKLAKRLKDVFPNISGEPVEPLKNSYKLNIIVQPPIDGEQDNDLLSIELRQQAQKYGDSGAEASYSHHYKKDDE